MFGHRFKNIVEGFINRRVFRIRKLQRSTLIMIKIHKQTSRIATKVQASVEKNKYQKKIIRKLGGNTHTHSLNLVFHQSIVCKLV